MKRILYLSVVVLLVAGCSKPNTSGGIVFSFDGQSVQSWLGYRELFEKYHIKATFFVNPGDKEDPEMEKGLKTLKGDGHEIACHGISTISQAVVTMNAPAFYAWEAGSQIKLLEDMGFNIESYAYTYALAPDSLDKYMLGKFKYLRKSMWNQYNTTIDNYDNIFARPDSFSVVHSMGIDCNNLISLENLQSGIERAKKNNEVLVLHAHKIDASGLNFTINPQYLEEVFKLCKKENIPSIRIRDLDDFFKKRSEKQKD
jgi:peptidoglycan-N-acetylglucosamine deacetylase